MQTLKLSKLRARQIAEPKLKLKYPKKFSIKTEDSSLTLLKNDLPWTLHPLPPPLPTAKTIKLEMDKSMPWALHPLPPPVKTKNYSDYYWPDAKTHPKFFSRFKPPKPHRVVYNNNHNNNNNKFLNSRPSTHFKPSDFKHPDFKPSVFKHSDFKPSIYKPIDYNSKHEDHNKHTDNKPINYKPHGYKSMDYDKPSNEYKHIDYKNVEYKHVDYKSPDYKTEYPKQMDEESVDDDHHIYHEPYSHDDHSSEINDLPSPSSQPPSSEYVSHISIEPSIQIASFSETELQGDGTNRETVSQGDEKQRCQCTTNGHRHKRSVNNDWVSNSNTTRNANTTSVIAVQVKDSVVGQSLRNSYVTPNVGHATEVQIIKSQDITDQSILNNPIGYVQQVRNLNTAAESPRQPTEINRGEPKKIETTFRDDSDKFKVDFGREINAWDESKSNADKGRFQLKSNDNRNIDGCDSDGIGSDGGSKHGCFNIDDYGTRMTRKPGRVYQVTKSKIENSDRGVAFSVQTPFSVSSFSSNIRHPGTEERQSPFRFNEPRTTSSPLLSSFQSEYSEPLDFEQFGLHSVLTDDKPPSDSGRLTSHFLQGFKDKPSGALGQLTSNFPESFSSNNRPSDYSGRLSSHFSRDYGDDDRGRSKQPFRYSTNKHGSDRFNSRLKGNRGSSSEESVLEYFQPVVIDFDKSKDDNNNNFKSFGNIHGGSGGDKLRYFGKTESTGFLKFKKNQNPDPLRMPGRLHESNENLSRKLVFHPSTFDID